MSDTFVFIFLLFAVPVGLSFISNIIASIYIEGWIIFGAYLVYLEKHNLMMVLVPFLFLQCYIPINYYLTKSIKESL
jgi:hypothetical protein